MNLTDIHERLNRIERQNRILKTFVTTVGVLIVTLGAASACCHRFGEIQAERVTLIDCNGVERGAFELQGSGEPRLVMKNRTGKTMVNIGILWGNGDNSTAGILIAGPNGSAVLKGIASDDIASWEIMKSNNRIGLRSETSVKPVIQMRDDTGTRVTIDSTPTPATLSLQ